MSARGWADTLTRAADVAELEAKHYDAKRTAEYREAAAVARGDAAALRELAALLDRITPEAVTVAEMLVGYPDLPPLPDLFAALRELSRGPAEQQETGR